MSSINVSNVIVVKPKSYFTDKIVFDIAFECSSAISTFINWKVIYIGSATSKAYDQTLADVNVGPIEKGMNRFVLQADPPKYDEIPHDEFSMTVIILCASYNEQEFLRIGYYVTNNIPDDAGDNPDLSKIERVIQEEDITVQHSRIKWD